MNDDNKSTTQATSLNDEKLNKAIVEKKSEATNDSSAINSTSTPSKLVLKTEQGELTIEDHSAAHQAQVAQNIIKNENMKIEAKAAKDKANSDLANKKEDNRHDEQTSEECHRHNEAKNQESNRHKEKMQDNEDNKELTKYKIDAALKAIGITIVGIPTIYAAATAYQHAVEKLKTNDLEKSKFIDSLAMYKELGVLINNLERAFEEKIKKTGTEHDLEEFHQCISRIKDNIPDPEGRGKVLCMRLDVLKVNVESKQRSFLPTNLENTSTSTQSQSERVFTEEDNNKNYTPQFNNSVSSAPAHNPAELYQRADDLISNGATEQAKQTSRAFRNLANSFKAKD